MLHYQIITVTAFAQNCTLLWDERSKEAVLIDAGGDVPRLKQAIEAAQVKLVALWLTHGHIDHAGAVGELAQYYQVPVIGPHRADEFWLQMLETQSKMFGFPTAQPVQVDQWLAGNETLYLGNYPIEVRFTPGHTPGHVVLYSKDLNLVWTGDVLFAGAIGRTDFPQGNYQQLIDSIHREIFSLPDDTRFIAGHGPMSSVGQEKQTNPFLAGKAG